MAAAEKMVHDLLSHGADVSLSDVYGRTPLMMAAMHSWPGVVRELIAAHAEVNAKDHEGRIAIDYADPSDHETITVLRKAGSRKPTGHSGRIVCDAERALNFPIQDCIPGRELTRSVKEFQEAHALNTTGRT